MLYIVLTMLKILLFIIMFKDLSIKFRKPVSYWLSMQIKGDKDDKLRKSSLLFCWECLNFFWVLIPVSWVTNFICISGISYQIFFLVKLISNYNVKNNSNCNCFILGIPRVIEMKHILNNMLISYFFISIFLINNYGGN